MIAQTAFFYERKQLQRRSVRYALLSIFLTVVLLISTGCSLMLEGNELSAYKYIVNSSQFENAQSVQMLSGRMYGSDLYGYFAYTTNYGSRRVEMYRISSSGYTRTVSITLYSLNDAERCLAEGYLDLDAINSALEIHYGSPLSGVNGLVSNLLDGGNNMFLSIIILIVVLCLHGLLCSKASDIAQDKGYEKSTWFHMCFWLGPISFIIIASMPDRVMRTKQDETNNQLRQLLEHAKQNKTDVLLSQLIECTQNIQTASAGSSGSSSASVSHETSSHHTMRRRTAAAPINQND